MHIFLFLKQLFWDQTVIGGPLPYHCGPPVEDPCIKLNCVFCCCHVLFSSRYKFFWLLAQIELYILILVMRGTERSFVSLGFWLCWIPLGFSQFVDVCVRISLGRSGRPVSFTVVFSTPSPISKSPGSIACIWPKSPWVSVGSQTWVTHCWHESFTYYFHGLIFLYV